MCFASVGGTVFDAVPALLNDFARVPVCGLVPGCNFTGLPPGPDRSPVLMRAVTTKRVTLQGFIVWDFADREAASLQEVGGWLAKGRVRWRGSLGRIRPTGAGPSGRVLPPH